MDRAEFSVSGFFGSHCSSEIVCSWNLVLILDPRLLLCMLSTSFWFRVLKYLEHDSDSGYETRLKLRISLLFRYFPLKKGFKTTRSERPRVTDIFFQGLIFIEKYYEKSFH